MKEQRLLSAVGLVMALAVAGWQVDGAGDAPVSRLVFAGAAAGLFLLGLAVPFRVSPQRHRVLIGLGFLCLSLGSPAAWLLGAFAGVGSVLLWRAYQAKYGQGKGSQAGDSVEIRGALRLPGPADGDPGHRGGPVREDVGLERAAQPAVSPGRLRCGAAEVGYADQR